MLYLEIENDDNDVASKYDMRASILNEGVIEDAAALGLPDDYNPKKVDPALLTYDEYYKIVNKNDTFHPSSAYDVDLAKLNAYRTKDEYPRLLRQFRINGLAFELRLKLEKNHFVKTDQTGEHVRVDGEVQYWSDDEARALGRPLHTLDIAVYTGNVCVATVQDEWGCLLVMVAREYRGFGLAPLLVKLMRSIEPDRPSGGFTRGGLHNFRKVYREFVRNAASSGKYRALVRQGDLTMERVREIFNSAKGLPAIQPTQKLDLADNPNDYLLYVGEFGDFILYDRKLFDVIKGGDRLEHFKTRFVKGIAYVESHSGREDWGHLAAFGGDTPAIRKFLMTCAVEYARKENLSLYLENDEPSAVDPSMAAVDAERSPRIGFWSRKCVPTGKTFDYRPLGLVEQIWRRKHDQYDEFKHEMMEMAYAKFRHD